MRASIWGVLLAVAFGGCGGNADPPSGKQAEHRPAPDADLPLPPLPPAAPAARPRNYKVVHVLVALCDNKHQGIVPVPAALGNGRDPKNNLYWGAMYGVKTFFKRSTHWTAITSFTKPKRRVILDRCVFKSAGAGPTVYVVADAYDGAHMKAALQDFFGAAGGKYGPEVRLQHDRVLEAGWRADMVCFVGHNGLMDMRTPDVATVADTATPECAVVLACKSHQYFVAPLRAAKCPPLLTTTGLMAPEAYTLDAVIRSWAGGDAPATVRKRAAQAYAAYQRISVRAAERLFAVGRLK